MEAITREEIYLAGTSGESVELPEPITRRELFFAKLAGKDVETPEPITREEMFLKKATENNQGSDSDFTEADANAALRRLSSADGFYEKVNDLTNQKTALAETLQGANVEANVDETYSTLVPKSNDRLENLTELYNAVTTDGKDFSYLFYERRFRWITDGMYQFRIIPFIDTSNGTNFSYMFSHTYEIASRTLPYVPDTSNGTNFSYMFSWASNVDLTTLPHTFNTSNGINFEGMFKNASMSKCPALDTSNGTNFKAMFQQCGIKEFPMIDTSKGTDFQSMFYGVKLSIVPQLNVSNGTNFSNMFNNCVNLEEVSSLDTSNGTNFANMFAGCSNLKTIHGLDFSSLIGTPSANTMPCNLSSLENLTLNGILQVTMSFNKAPLTAESAKSVINALVNYVGTDAELTRTIYFSETTWGYLDAEGETASPNGNSWREYIGDKGWLT